MLYRRSPEFNACLHFYGVSHSPAQKQTWTLRSWWSWLWAAWWLLPWGKCSFIPGEDCSSCGSPSIYTCISINPCFTVPNKIVIEVYLSSIHSSSKGTGVKTHEIIQGGSFWATQYTPQLNLVHNQEDPVKTEHAKVQPEKKESIQSNQGELEPEVPNDTPTDPLKLVHLDLKGAAPKVKYLEQVGMCVNRIVFQTCGIMY